MNAGNSGAWRAQFGRWRPPAGGSEVHPARVGLERDGGGGEGRGRPPCPTPCRGKGGPVPRSWGKGGPVFKGSFLAEIKLNAGANRVHKTSVH